MSDMINPTNIVIIESDKKKKIMFGITFIHKMIHFVAI